MWKNGYDNSAIAEMGVKDRKDDRFKLPLPPIDSLFAEISSAEQDVPQRTERNRAAIPVEAEMDLILSHLNNKPLGGLSDRHLSKPSIDSHHEQQTRKEEWYPSQHRMSFSDSVSRNKQAFHGTSAQIHFDTRSPSFPNTHLNQHPSPSLSHGKSRANHFPSSYTSSVTQSRSFQTHATLPPKPSNSAASFLQSMIQACSSTPVSISTPRPSSLVTLSTLKGSGMNSSPLVNTDTPKIAAAGALRPSSVQASISSLSGSKPSQGLLLKTGASGLSSAPQPLSGISGTHSSLSLSLSTSSGSTLPSPSPLPASLSKQFHSRAPPLLPKSSVPVLPTSHHAPSISVAPSSSENLAESPMKDVQDMLRERKMVILSEMLVGPTSAPPREVPQRSSSALTSRLGKRPLPIPAPVTSSFTTRAPPSTVSVSRPNGPEQSEEASKRQRTEQ